jgi:hypothetical protein
MYLAGKWSLGSPRLYYAPIGYRPLEVLRMGYPTGCNGVAPVRDGRID